MESKVGAKETGFVNVKARFEDALQQAVATFGPVSVAIDAGEPSFFKYKSGEFETRFTPGFILFIMISVYSILLLNLTEFTSP